MSVKLYYFDAHGICDPIRLILTYGGIEFDDIRAPVDTFPPNLPADIKSKCRWGQVPMVEFDGKSLNQSLAITRYFAKKVNLVPQDSYEAALCDEYVDATRDLMSPWYVPVTEKDAQKKQEKIEEARKATKTRFLDVFENIVKSNDGKHLVGKSLTWADVYLAYLIQLFEILLGVNIVSEHPGLKALRDNVLNEPNIKKWIDRRPNTTY